MPQDQLILNRYRPISDVGSGGYGTVQLAWDTRIQRRVAIKKLPLGKDHSPSSGNLPGLDEARTAAMLNDTNIVGVYDFEVQDDYAYLILEYVDGLTLTQLLREFGNEISLNAVATVFSSIAHALEVAHDNQVLHLDIKPDNVLIGRQGQVKVTDFGLATLSSVYGYDAAKGGTIGYMPPEQMRQEMLDARCDEWALASITYEMLSGTNPFLASDLTQAQVAIENAELVLPSLCREDLPPEADDVIFTALDPDRDERFENVAAFALELEDFLGDPERGRKELSILVGNASEDSESDEELGERMYLFDRIGDRTKSVVARVWGALNVGMLSFLALTNIPQVGGWTSWLFWGLFALIVLAAVLKPHLGAVLGLVALGSALIVQEAYAIGVVFLILAVLWWFFAGRKGHIQADTALNPLLFGSFGFNQFTPLCNGFFLTMKETLINTAFAFVLTLVLASFGSLSLLGWNVLAFWNSEIQTVQDNLIMLLQQPMTWFVALSWMLAAISVRLFCLRQTRAFALIGAVVGTVLLLGGLCAGTFVASGGHDWIPHWYEIIPTTGAGIVLVVCSALGVPNREIAQ